jgi:hypothetical protein
MQLPGWSANLDEGKRKLGEHYKALEMRVLNECAGLAKSGFADARLAANAYNKFEEAFLLMRKALRIAAEADDPNEYGKKPTSDVPVPQSFKPEGAGDFDDKGDLRRASQIEWKDLPKWDDGNTGDG